MDTEPSSPPPVDAGTLRFLKFLTGTLSAVMIVGIAVIVTLLVMRLNAGPAPAPLPLPDQITLPDGASPVAVTYGPGWYAVTLDDAILIYSADGTLRQSVPVAFGE